MTRTELLWQARITSPFGELRLVASSAGLRAILWPVDSARVPLGSVAVDIDESENEVTTKTAAQLKEYFEGSRKRFDLPLDPVGTAFQIAAWFALAEIPFGQTATYTEQATRIGRPEAVRAVGAANGRNPISIVLPCHRVIGADGSLTGFAGGLDAKEWLLNHEGATFAGSAPRLF
jgi:methylated-DNA-[protein]-cysteine S-methyltransferase